MKHIINVHLYTQILKFPKVGFYFRITGFFSDQFGKRWQSDIELYEKILLRMRNQKMCREHFNRGVRTERVVSEESRIYEPFIDRYFRFP